MENTNNSNISVSTGAKLLLKKERFLETRSNFDKLVDESMKLLEKCKELNTIMSEMTNEQIDIINGGRMTKETADKHNEQYDKYRIEYDLLVKQNEKLYEQIYDNLNEQSDIYKKVKKLKLSKVIEQRKN